MNDQLEISQGPFKLLNYYTRPTTDVPWFETDQATKQHIHSAYENNQCVFVKYEFNNGFEKVIEVHLKNYEFLVKYLVDPDLSDSRTMRKLYDFENRIVNSRRELIDIPNNRDIVDIVFNKSENNTYSLNYENLQLF